MLLRRAACASGGLQSSSPTPSDSLVFSHTTRLFNVAVATHMVLCRLLYTVRGNVREDECAWSNREVTGPSMLMRQPLWRWYAWNEHGTTTDSWIPLLCGATERPLSYYQVSWSLARVNHSVTHNKRNNWGQCRWLKSRDYYFLIGLLAVLHADNYW